MALVTYARWISYPYHFVVTWLVRVRIKIGAQSVPYFAAFHSVSLSC